MSVFLLFQAFTRCENKGALCDYRYDNFISFFIDKRFNFEFFLLLRLAQEGSLMTIPFLGKRILRPSVEDLEVLLLSSDVEMPPSHGKLVSLNEQYLPVFSIKSLLNV